MALYRRAGTGEADKRLRSKFREDRQMENVNNTARPSKEDEALFSDIARDIKANLDNYKEAGQWLDDNFGEAVRERLRQNKQKHGLAHCFNDAIGNTIGRPPDKPGTLQVRLTQKEARRLLLIIWLLTDTADLTKTPKLTEFQLLPYEHDDCDVVVRDDDDYDDENKQRIYASVLGYIKSREYLFREFLEKNSEYNRLLSAARKAWSVLFGPRNTTAQQPAIPTEQVEQDGGETGATKTETPSEYRCSKSIPELINQGENHTLEFKETLQYNIHTKKKDNEILNSSLKTIAGFLNANGGTLLIGVSDDGNTNGIDKDLKILGTSASEDAFERKIRDCISGQNSKFEPSAIGKVNISFENKHGNTICRVDVQPLPKPDVLHFKGDVHVRDGNQTILLTGSKLTNWIIKRKV